MKYIIKIFILLSIATIYSNLWAATPSADWHFDELSWNGTQDEIRDSQGTYHGTAKDTFPVEGKICNAIDFRKNGTTDYAILGEGAIDGASDFTISVWHKGDSGDDSNALLSGARSDADNALLWWHGGSSFYPYYKSSYGPISGPDINDESWHHLVWRREGTTTSYLVDGVLQGSLSINEEIPISISSLILGQDQDSVGGSFDGNQDWEGLLDELIIFKEALTDNQILDIYNNQNAGKNWDGTTRICQLIKVTLPSNTCLYESQINLTTYDTSGYSYNGSYYPNDDIEYKQWISDRATDDYEHGSSYIDNIYTSSGSNNDPHQTDDDTDYLAIMEGYIFLPTSGVYQIGIDGDDAVEVYIDDELITGWWGGHGAAGSAQGIVKIDALTGYHKVEFHMQEHEGGDSYYLYWDRGDGGSMEIVPASNYFHCVMPPEMHITKSSIVTSDPVNNTTKPKRIPGAVIRYCFTVDNNGTGVADSIDIHDSLTGDGKENLDYMQSGKKTTLQTTVEDCDCTAIDDTSGSISGDDVTINIGTMGAGTRSCAYIDTYIK